MISSSSAYWVMIFYLTLLTTDWSLWKHASQVLALQWEVGTARGSGLSILVGLQPSGFTSPFVSGDMEARGENGGGYTRLHTEQDWAQRYGGPKPPLCWGRRTSWRLCSPSLHSPHLSQCWYLRVVQTQLGPQATINEAPVITAQKNQSQGKLLQNPR